MQVAVVGLGYWGPNLVRNLTMAAGCDSVAVLDLDPARMDQVARLYPSVRRLDSFLALLEDGSIEAIVLATPIVTHHDLARQALDAGKHVLVEKPLATSAHDADALVELARRKERVLVAGHTFLFSPPVREVRRRISAGEIGDPLYVMSSRMNLGVHQSDVSVIWDLAPHDLSILFEWLREFPRRVSATGRATHGGKRADVAFLTLEFPSGCLANIHLSWLAPTKVRRVTLVGSRRMVVYEDTDPEEPVKIYDKGIAVPDPNEFGHHQLTYRSGDIVSPRIEAAEPLRVELEAFIERISRREYPDAREHAAIRVVETIEAAERSSRDGGSPVSLGEA